MKRIRLNDGNEIPAIGFGTFQIPADGSTYEAVKVALSLGVRHIDTAVAYFNEHEVGAAVADSGIPRDEIWITSKMWLQDYKHDEAMKALDLSLKKLQTDYIDLYMLHQPYGEVAEAWAVLEDAQRAGKVRSIGASNMTPKIWAEWVPQFSVVPSVDQVEFNPYFQQRELKPVLAEYGTKMEAWSPLGRGDAKLLAEPVTTDLAAKYGKDAGQVVLRFINQEGVIAFPRSTKPERIKSNMKIFDFELTGGEMDAMRALDKGFGTHDPDRPGLREMFINAFDVHAGE